MGYTDTLQVHHWILIHIVYNNNNDIYIYITSIECIYTYTYIYNTGRWFGTFGLFFYILGMS